MFRSVPLSDPPPKYVGGESLRFNYLNILYRSEVGKSEQSESNREIGFGSVALRCDAKLCERVRERVLTK